MMDNETQAYSDDLSVRKRQILEHLKHEVVHLSNRRKRRKQAISILSLLMLFGCLGWLTLRTDPPKKQRLFEIVRETAPKTESTSSQYLTIDRSTQSIHEFDFKIIGNREFEGLYAASGRCGTPIVANGAVHILGCEIN